MQAFNFSTTAHLICASGAAAQLAEQCAARGARNVLLVTDAGILRHNLLDSVLPGFTAAGINLQVYSDVLADPAEELVLAATEQARAIGADLIVGFGGGSSMDTAKLVAYLAHPEQRQTLSDIYGVNQANGARLPLIQVPTTAGTGSEVTPISIVTTATGKSGVVSQQLLPDLAILDAQLTVGLPGPVTAATGIDAMVHAIEAYTSKLRKNPISDLLAREALRLLSANLEQAVREPQDLEARQAMLLGACLAGQAFANAPVAAVHALAYPLGITFHLPHGLSNALVLNPVLTFNLSHAHVLYAELAPCVLGERLLPGDGAAQLIEELRRIHEAVGLPLRLRDAGVTLESLPELARSAMQQQRLLVNNPRPVLEEDALAIYTAAY